MKKLTLILATVIGATSLVACGKESDFKKAINAKLSQSPKCIRLSTSNYIAYSDLSESDSTRLKENNKNDFLITQTFDKDGKIQGFFQKGTEKEIAEFDTLTAAGLLTKSTEKLSTIGWDKQPNGGYNLITIYTLTDAGKKTLDPNRKLENPDGYASAELCYATPEVDKIENYTDIDGAGVKAAEVKYSYDYTNVADWAKKDDVKAAFPEISKTLDNPDKTASIGLVKTNNGWSTDL
jgi:hypothetical protein